MNLKLFASIYNSSKKLKEDELREEYDNFVKDSDLVIAYIENIKYILARYNFHFKKCGYFDSLEDFDRFHFYKIKEGEE